jgi:transposase
MAGRLGLTDEQWELIEPIFFPVRRKDNHGIPWHDTRAVLNGVLWILGSGAQWAEMPGKYPSYQKCHRRLQHSVREGRFIKVSRLLALHLHDRGKLNLTRHLWMPLLRVPKRGFAICPTKPGKGTKIVAIAAGNVLPLAVAVESASPAECKVVEAVLAGCFLDELLE